MSAQNKNITNYPEDSVFMMDDQEANLESSNRKLKLKIKQAHTKESIVIKKDQDENQHDQDHFDQKDPEDAKKQGKANTLTGNLSPNKLMCIKQQSEQVVSIKEMSQQQFKPIVKLNQDKSRQSAAVGAQGSLKIPSQMKSLQVNQIMKFSPSEGRPSVESNPKSSLQLNSQISTLNKINQHSRDSNLTKQTDEEFRRIEEEQLQKLQEQQKLKEEKQNFKLADYFVTVGIDDFQTQSEQNSLVEEAKETNQIQAQVQFYDDEDDFDKVVSKLEIYVIKDNSIFKEGCMINGVQANIIHPDNINSPNEKWIDLKGNKFIYLKVSYDNIKNCKRPITDLNFYKISRYRQQPDKMMIKVKQNIEPLPVKVFGDPDADKKYKKTKKFGKKETPGGEDDMYNFYGNYDLTSYLEDTTTVNVNQKNLCLCQSVKRQAPIQDIFLVVGDKIDSNTGQIISNDDAQSQINLEENNHSINWDVPEGYKGLAYSIGQNGYLNRLLCKKHRDIMKRKLKAKVIDRYPVQDRHYYPFPTNISEFCFPSGVVLKTEYGPPEFFNFILTDQDGNHIYCTCLIFDEDLSKGFQDMLAAYNVKNPEKVRGLKSVCILSHYCFYNQFKDILKQLYRMQISNTALQIPIERYITNIIDEIPLPDEGKLLIQYEVGGETASFYRPIDQHPPCVDSNDIENILKCLDVDSILEVFSAILLEKKLLFISKHKSLLTQAISCFVSFIFPFQWKHTIIPILPLNMIDILDAPFPYLIGIEPNSGLEMFDLESEVIIIELDIGRVLTPNDALMQSQMPKMPFKEHKMLKHRLVKATESILQKPDEQMLKQCDLAFNMTFIDPEEDHPIDYFEVRDAFLEFMSSIMSDYTKFLIDPSFQPETITCSKDFFDMHGFRFAKEAKKNYQFVYKLTETNHFTYFIESRCFGKSDRDYQIMHFDLLLNQKRSRMNPKLVFPFAPEKSIKALMPNEEGLVSGIMYNYKIFPKFDQSNFMKPRNIPIYNQDSLQQQIIGQLISNEKLTKMHDNEWARYNLEVLYLLWFQIFATTLPIYGAHSSGLIDFAKKLLSYIRTKIKPMRDIEFIYRRLFASCGSCKQINHLREIYKDMIKNKIEPDKVTSGTYYQALLQCKRRGGAKENEQDLRKSYFNHRMEDYQKKLNNHQDDDNRSRNSRQRESNLTQDQVSNYSANKQPFRQVSRSKEKTIEGEYDFSQVLDQKETTQFTASETIRPGQSNLNKLSYILENSLYFEIGKNCLKCKQPLREEEVITGFQKNLSSYTCKCPICGQMFVPKFSIHGETDNQYINGKSGETIQMLPPVCLYKEFINIVSKESDQILMTDDFISKHKMVFWNIILYFKILKLPYFMVDLDYSPYHQKVHCSQIMKFLPHEKPKNTKSFFNRQDSSSRALPPKLNSSALKQLNDQNLVQKSPFKNPTQNSNVGGIHFQNNLNAIRTNLSIVSGSSAVKEQETMNERPSIVSGNRKSSMQRMKQGMMSMFSAKKSNAGDSHRASQEQDIMPFNDKVTAIHFKGKTANVNYAHSHAHENDKKGFQNIMNLGISNVITNLKKPSSQKSAGAVSAITSLSDLEKIEKIMNEAQHADKNIVKYFGKYFEEFRRDMHYYKEIVFSELYTQYGAGLNDNQEQENIQLEDQHQ